MKWLKMQMRNGQIYEQQKIYRTIQQGPLKTITLFSQPYLDTYNQCYKNIITLSSMPQGPLASIVRRVQFPILSEFKSYGYSSCNTSKTCGLALISIANCAKNDLMDVDEVPILMSFLLSNGYSIDTSITKMFNQSDIRFQTNNSNTLICFIAYNGSSLEI